MRYYDLRTRTETHVKSDTTVESTNARVSEFFKPLEEGYELTFDEDSYPLITKKIEKTADEIEALNVLVKIAEYKAYLVSTDWYMARKVETGEEIPEDVAIKRTEAREFIRSQEDA